MVISSLHPKALLNRWKAEQLSKISRVLEQGKDFVKEHPRLLTGTGVAILLLTATRPFRNLLRRKRGNKKSNVDNIE